jgi:hypothetical protein
VDASQEVFSGGGNARAVGLAQAVVAADKVLPGTRQVEELSHLTRRAAIRGPTAK